MTLYGLINSNQLVASDVELTLEKMYKTAEHLNKRAEIEREYMNDINAELQALLDSKPPVEVTPQPDVNPQEDQLKALEEFEKLIFQARQLTLQMNSRQIGRVFRSLLKTPLHKPEKLMSQQEHLLLMIATTVIDTKIKMLATAMYETKNFSQMGAENEAALNEARVQTEAQEVADVAVPSNQES